jgi:phenylacetate-CoA ligase
MALEDTLYPLLKLYESAPQSVKSLLGRSYRALPKSLRYGPSYGQFRADAEAIVGWDLESIQHYQVDALRESLIAASTAPFYARRFAELGLVPTTFDSLEQLSAYPMLTKEDLILHREEMVNPNTAARDRLSMTTGGSSGIPVSFYLQKGVSRPKEQAYLEASWARRGYHTGDRVAMIRGGLFHSLQTYDAARDWLILSSAHLTVERLPEYVAALNAFRPRHLHAYPSSALLLARGMKQRHLSLDFALVSLLCGSEKLSHEEQTELQTFFGAPVLHWYGHSERVVLAAQGTNSDHLYFWPTYGYAELGEPNTEGFCEVIATSFHNRVMPLIRYRTGDYVRRPSTAHRELPMLEVSAVVGREHEFLISSNGRRVSLTAINRHDEVFNGLLAVQFHQSKPGDVELWVQPGPLWKGKIDAISCILSQQLGTDFLLTLKTVDHIPKTARGKQRWLVSQLTQLPR